MFTTCSGLRPDKSAAIAAPGGLEGRGGEERDGRRELGEAGEGWGKRGETPGLGATPPGLNPSGLHPPVPTPLAPITLAPTPLGPNPLGPNPPGPPL